jgi:hypothetical protein
MVSLVCKERPHFAAWVLLGYVPKISVDPTDESSVKAWKKKRLEEFAALRAVAKESDSSTP